MTEIIMALKDDCQFLVVSYDMILSTHDRVEKKA